MQISEEELDKIMRDIARGLATGLYQYNAMLELCKRLKRRGYKIVKEAECQKR